MQPVRDRYAALFGPGIVTVRQFIWRLDVVAVAHFVMDCFDLGMHLTMMCRMIYLISPRGTDVIHFLLLSLLGGTALHMRGLRE